MSNSPNTQPQERILLMGNPNVGKSVFFTEFTGIHAISSNFVGTTVNYMEGHLPVGDREFTLIDVPGTYSLSTTSEAEDVAANFLEQGARAIIFVLDASNLERNLCLALEIRKYNIPTIFSLNLLDVAKRRGIIINEKLLEQELGAPVIPTIAVKKHGLDELINRLAEMLDNPEKYEQKACTNCAACVFRSESEKVDVWCAAKDITKRVSSTMGKGGKQHFFDKLGAASVKPWPGIPIAFLVMATLIAVVVVGGDILKDYALLPLVEYIIVPFFRNLFSSFIPEGMLLNILVGEFGIFVISFEWILAVIFPFVFLFYVAFSFLEDSGYLPRVSVLFDNIMRKLGVQGGSLIYTTMGFGCAVPAIIGSRAATSRKERLVITAAICFAIPCISQTGALISLLSAYAWWMMPAMALFGFALFVAVSLVAGKLIKGKVDPLIIEIPNLLLPDPRTYGRKLLTRMKHFLKDAQIPMMVAIVIAAVIAESGLLNIIAHHAEPLVSQWLGMPQEAVVALILGIVRREMSVAPLLALDLTALQAFVGGAVALMYIPCLSVFAILVKEHKLKIAGIITVGSIVVALFLGGVINQVGQLFI